MRDIASELRMLARRLPFDSERLLSILQRRTAGKAFLRSAKWILQVVGGRNDVASQTSISDGYVFVSKTECKDGGLDGWCSDRVAYWQDSAYQPLLAQMRRGQPRLDLLAAAQAVRLTALSDPLILEVGCGSGYYSEVLSCLLQKRIRYVGVDYSRAMIRLARKRYRTAGFLVGDAAALPFDSSSVDVVLNGTSLMHILEYKKAIEESQRVGRHWCIFHTVPILERGPTRLMKKNAYGGPTVEIIFNEDQLCRQFTDAGLRIEHVLDSIPYNLEAVLGERTCTKTDVCRVIT